MHIMHVVTKPLQRCMRVFLPSLASLNATHDVADDRYFGVGAVMPEDMPTTHPLRADDVVYGV